jgi:hypothetical protein
MIWMEVLHSGKLALSLQPEILKKFIQRSDYISGTDPGRRAFATFVNSLKTRGHELVLMIVE